MSMRKLLFIYNPHAGKGLVRGKLASILDTFTGAGYLVTAYPTQAKGDATRCAAKLGKKFDRVVCSGGDGTLSETIAGLLTLSNPPMLGYIPAGTTNDCARNLRIPKGMEKAAWTAVYGTPRATDMGKFGDRFFTYVAAFGAFTDVAYDTPQDFKNTFGHFAYVLEGMARLGNIKSYRLKVEHDDGVIEGDFIFGMVSNTLSVGGFQGLPMSEVRLDDGRFEIILIRKPANPLEYQSILLSLVRQEAEKGGPLLWLHSARLKVSSAEPLPWTLDGEYGGDPETVEIKNLTRAVTLVWGK